MLSLEARLTQPELPNSDRQFLSGIQKCGWSVVMIPEDDEGPGFAYSVGLFHSFGHPELVMFGLRLEPMQGIINAAGERIRAGERFQVFTPTRGVLENYEAIFLCIPRTHFKEYFGMALWFYQETEFEALQLVYPDRFSRFPWDPEAHELFVQAQPILGVKETS